MANTKKTAASQSTAKGKAAAKGTKKSSPGKANAAKAEVTVTEVRGNGANGDCGNGKTRCKSLVIDGTKYRTQFNYKFENRRTWQNPDNRKITSSIPGTVIKIFVEEGQEVMAGEQMLILEAMKMKNKILFSVDGVIGKIHVKEGEKIPKDHLLVELK